jgi:DinB family protein
VTELPVPSKARLLEALRSSRDRVLATVSAISPSALEEGRYENGWNGRQILAHLASIEWTYPRLIDIARAPSAHRATEGQPPSRGMRGGNDAYNERQVAKRAHLSAAALLEEFERNRASTILAVEAAEDELFTRPIRSAGGVTGVLSAVLYQVAVEHVLNHARDIVRPHPRAEGDRSL